MTFTISLLCFKGQRVVVLGLGRSGQRPAQALIKGGATVLAWDDSASARTEAIAQGIPVLENPQEIDWKTVDHFLLSPGIPHTYPAPHPLATLARTHNIPPIGDIECFLRSEPVAPIVGVTGTNGKSTTAALIVHLLNFAGKETALGGNIGIPVFALPVLTKSGVYILELSSYQLELTPSLALSLGVLLNLSPDHLDRHGGMEGYIRAKKLIFQNRPLNAKAVVGVDDPFCVEIFQELEDKGGKQSTVTPISAAQRLEKGVSVIDAVLEDTIDPLCPVSFSLKGIRSLKGRHNGQNAAAAFAAVRLLGVPPAIIQQGLQTFPGLPHRQEWIETKAGIDYINDSKATNAEAVACALACYRQDHTLYWIAGGRPKEAGLNPLAPFWKDISHAFLIGEAAEAFGAILKDQNVPYLISETLEKACFQATQWAQKEKKPSPLVLLSPACTSFDQFKSFEHRGEAFRKWVLEQE